MFYIVARHMYQWTVYETNTESRMSLTDDEVRALINRSRAKVVNAKLDSDGNIKLNDWPQGMVKSSVGFGEKYCGILLGKVGNDRYKIMDSYGEISIITKEKLLQYTACSGISNCEISHSKFSYVDSFDTDVDEQFKKNVDNQYDKFIAKSKLMGIDLSFEYTIEDNQVKITKYTGTSTKVIIPSFVTTINEKAFFKKKITDIKMTEGLRFIGSNAFDCNDLSTVQLPKTVYFVGESAFRVSPNLFKLSRKCNWEYNEETFKIQNKKALIMTSINKR